MADHDRADPSFGRSDQAAPAVPAYEGADPLGDDPMGAFENHPPKDDGYPPVGDIDVRAATLSNGWRMLAASMRGLSHRHRARYRDDCLDFRRSGTLPAWQVAAVADGAGSQELSRLGAYAASRAAVEAIVDTINQNPRVFGERETPTAGRMADLLAQGLRAAYNAVLDLAKQWERDADMFSTTLALVVFGAISSGSQVAACAQIGDGATGIFIPNPSEPGSFRFHLLAQPDEGEIASTTRFLHQVEPGEWPDRIQVLTLPPDAEAIVLATDGVAADFQPLRQHFGRLYARLRSAVLPLANTEAVASLCQVMQWQRPDSFDDRTLLIIHRPVAMGEAGPPPQE